ncbi:TatD DNase family protein [Clostridium cavendishii DSM 21758]|uniref:TatD DNase family protein n=1 Tax=Clostridium cavendishii DSM 21758 TaxID=1121302 RepID=A0A1M6G7C1_9CLOT|nr:TatD family hydrolase [Clostridium cavendishii]SHJ05833.1 TatD DNase family protein [Clostridium cavendishii DSM 21758]
MNLVDIGLNLMHKSYDKDREEVVERAVKAGVSNMIITGTNINSSNKALHYTKKYPGILYSTAGVHPHDTHKCNLETINSLKSLALCKEVVAIGECGLDFNRNFSPRNVQEKWFDSQIQLACELDMPLFLHERDAHERFLAILSNYNKSIKKAVVHCFTGSANELDKYLSNGYYIGVTGWICDKRRGMHLRELVKRIPTEKLMIETDAPFLTPRDLVPKSYNGRNEPVFLTHILKTVAECAGKSYEEIAKTTRDNSYKFFGIDFK